MQVPSVEFDAFKQHAMEWEGYAIRLDDCDPSMLPPPLAESVVQAVRCQMWRHHRRDAYDFYWAYLYRFEHPVRPLGSKRMVRQKILGEYRWADFYWYQIGHLIAVVADVKVSDTSGNHPKNTIWIEAHDLFPSSLQYPAHPMPQELVSVLVERVRLSWNLLESSWESRWEPRFKIYVDKQVHPLDEWIRRWVLERLESRSPMALQEVVDFFLAIGFVQRWLDSSTWSDEESFLRRSCDALDMVLGEDSTASWTWRKFIEWASSHIRSMAETKA